MNRRQSLGGGGKQNYLLKEEKIIPLQTDQNNVIMNNKFGEHEVNMKKGFTLAEVLITLGIIGVVAALTLPTLIQNKHNRELETALKKNYSVIQNALQLMSYEEGQVINKDAARPVDGVHFYERFIKYFKTAKDCKAYDCVPSENIENEDGSVDTYRTKRYRNWNNTTYMRGSFLDDGQFMLGDGSMIYIENDSRTDYILISVDVNGLLKGPNRWGQDLFTFEIMKNGKLLPSGAEGTTYEGRLCSKTSTSEYNGIGCTYAALTDKNFWKNLPK